MQYVLQGRQLLSQLTNEEFEEFTLILIRKYGRNTMASCIFNFNNQQSHQYDMKEIELIINSIINERNEENNNNTTNNNESIQTCENITELHPVLISEISSYLEMKEYFCFRRTNTNVFLASSSLYSLSLPKRPEEYPFKTIAIQFNQYPSIKELKLDINVFNALVPRQQNKKFKWNHIEKLYLDGEFRDAEFDEFITNYLQKTINTNNITSLYCNQKKENKLNPASFLTLLSMLPNLEYIQLGNDFCLDDLSYVYAFDELSKLKYLRGIAINDFQSYTFGKALTRFCSNKLKSLGITTGELSQLDQFNKPFEFKELEKLMMFLDESNRESVSNILKTASKIKHIDLTTGCCCSGVSCTPIIAEIIQKQPVLETINCTLEEGGDWVIGGVESGLFLAKSRQRDCFGITFNTFTDHLTLELVILYSIRIINSMNSSKTKNFMLRWVLLDAVASDMNDLENLVENTFKNNKIKYWLQFDNSESFITFSISNSDKSV